jgi:acetylornithine deacetylase/succinyl-diaminopimelate desuccinylase-like protein
VTFKGPGGHSYSAFGLVNPAYALGNAMHKLSQVTVPSAPKVTYSVGVVGGGTSVNSIPSEVWMEVDMRSPSPTGLATVETTFLGLMREAVAEENAARSTAEGEIAVDLEVIGDRPSGETLETHRLVQIAAASVRAAGMTPEFVFSSTDANVPISMGIPAITLDAGGSSDRSHALDEWLDVEMAPALRGIGAALATILAVAEMR